VRANDLTYQAVIEMSWIADEGMTGAPVGHL